MQCFAAPREDRRTQQWPRRRQEHKCHHPGRGSRRIGRALYAERRRARIAKDQKPIHDHVHDIRDRRCDQDVPNGAHRLKRLTKHREREEWHNRQRATMGVHRRVLHYVGRLIEPQ